MDDKNGISITADDNVTLLKPRLLTGVLSNPPLNSDLDPSSNLYVKMHPYQQENDPMIDVPLVVIGPMSGPPVETFIGYGNQLYTDIVEVRVVCRDRDVGEAKISGELTRRKIIESIRAIVKANASNPGGTGEYLSMWYSGLMRDTDERQGSPLFRSTAKIMVQRLLL
jgi:hypothetical protein